MAAPRRRLARRLQPQAACVDLPWRRRDRHAASPVLQRHADHRARVRLGVQRARDRVAELLGFDAWENWRHIRAAPWMREYRWPIYFFLAVAFVHAILRITTHRSRSAATIAAMPAA